MATYKVAIIQLGYNDRKNIDEAVSTIKGQTYPIFKYYFIDNNSSDDSAVYLTEHFPEINLIRNHTNLGFAKANNRIMNKAFREGADFCLLLNTDIKASPEMLSQMVQTYDQQKLAGEKVGLIQASVLLYDQPDRINTVGNTIHYLGFGYCKDLNKKFRNKDVDQEITFASGSCLLISKDYYQDVGDFDRNFFMYHEDLNLAWRGLLKGYQHYCSVKALMWHKYNFGKGAYKMYHTEKNRLLVLLENYSFKSLMILLPVFMYTEFVISIYAIMNKWFLNKTKANFYILSHFPLIMIKRIGVQKSRTVSDRVIFSKLASRLQFDAVKSILISLFINHCYSIYYQIASFFI
jgi:GT2 family glycosyltransferase